MKYIIIFCLFIPFYAYSQDTAIVRFGFMAGINKAGINDSNNDNTVFQGEMVYEVGPVLKIKIYKNIFTENIVYVKFNTINAKKFDGSKSKYSFSFICIQSNLRIDFCKYFYTYGGLLININTEKESEIGRQSGIGAEGGLGISFDANFARIQICPYYSNMGIVLFNNNSNPLRLYNFGIRLTFL